MLSDELQYLLVYQLCSVRDIKSSFDRRKKGGRRNVLPASVGDAVVSVMPAKEGESRLRKRRV